jgi:hypothetical protein
LQKFFPALDPVLFFNQICNLLMKNEGVKMNQLYPDRYQEGKDMRVGQGLPEADRVKNSNGDRN